MKPATVLISVFLIVASQLIGCAPATQEPLMVFLVRHAEKVDDSADPALSSTGIERAGTLARTLRDAQIDTLHSSNFMRTRQTAAPLAIALGKTVQLYDPGDLSGLAATLRQSGGRHLVVGHSNTTPPLVELLGGDGGKDIDEATEYDRLYIVTIGSDGTTSSILLRFGQPYIKPSRYVFPE